MPFDNTAKETMLDALSANIDGVSIHTGDPGTGASNEVTGNGYSRQTPTFAAASGNSIVLDSDVSFNGPANEDALWFAIWDGSTRLGKGQISGDTAFSGDGEFVLTTATELSIED